MKSLLLAAGFLAVSLGAGTWRPIEDELIATAAPCEDGAAEMKSAFTIKGFNLAFGEPDTPTWLVEE